MRDGYAEWARTYEDTVLDLMDLRLLGIASTKRPVTELSRLVLPFTWAAFVIAVIAGSVLFMSKATDYFGNAVFWIKMVLIALAGINMIYFEFVTIRGVQQLLASGAPDGAAVA